MAQQTLDIMFKNLMTGMLCIAASQLAASPAVAESTLTVDLSLPYRPVTHVGNGSLYGVTEMKPADANALIAPLHPTMFTNPAAVGSGKQQPVGDAIVVAGRVAPFGATVTIRLADWFPGWYSFTNVDDWFTKISETVSRKKSANLSNVYAYEIWNEPNGTWKSDKPLAFNEFWRQSYVKLRQLDPTVKITGPSLAGYDGNFMHDFLSFCKTNKCLPDIIGWHDGESIANNVNAYRSLEKQLGVGPLPITVNEYSGSGRLNDEGRPGASAPLIAQLERSGVETACITYWDVPHPGRLGSLLATDTDRNGGWFFYKWYGEMTGNMVSATSSLAVNGKNLDGAASLDASAGNGFVILGGVNDGSIRIVVKGLKAAPFLGNSVRAVVERTPWASISTVVTQTMTVSTTILTVADDQLSVSISNTNANDGYRLSLTPAAGGTAGAGASAGSGGAVAGVGGSASMIGVVGGDGASGSGGRNGMSTAGRVGSSAPSAAAGSDAGGGSGGMRGGELAAGVGAAVAGSSSTASSAAAGGEKTPAGCFCQIGKRSSGINPAGAIILFSCVFYRRRTARRRGSQRPR